jgi:hypothetical protein
VLVVIGQISLITFCALAFCIYVGWGASGIALPRMLRPHAALLTPIVGYAIACWIGFMGVSTVLNLKWSLIITLLLATILNIWAWKQGLRPRPKIWLREWALFALLLVTLVVGVAPLLQYGYITVIGQGWDTESYLPMAQHMIDYPLSQFQQAPASSLRELTSNPPIIGVTLAFPVFQGFLMLLSQQTALMTFAPLQAFLRMLGILGIYIWLRATMGLGRRTALIGSAGASAGSLMLWISYFNFGMQMSAWPLLAAALTIGIATVEALASAPALSDNSQRRALIGQLILGAIVLAALPVAYYPALTIWIPMAAGLGAALVIEAFIRKAHPFRIIIAGLVLGAATALFGLITIFDYFEGFSFRYSIPAQHVGPERYIAPVETVGLAAFRLPDFGAQLPSIVLNIALAIMVVVSIIGLLLPRIKNRTEPENSAAIDKGWFALRWFLVVAGVLAYLIWLRASKSYPYAYMKGSSYAGFVAWGLFAFGLHMLALRLKRPQRWGLLLVAAIPLCIAIWSQVYTIRDHWRGPAIFGRDISAFDQAAQMIPQGSQVLLTSDSAFTGPISGQLMSSLYGNTILGHISTAYTSHDYWPAGQTPDYVVLAAKEDPWPLDYGAEEIWRSNSNAIFKLPSDTQILLGRSAIYSSAPPISRSSPGQLAIWRRGGENLSSTEFSIAVGDQLSFDQSAQGQTRLRSVQLRLASLQAQSLTLSYGEQSQQLELGAGVNEIQVAMQAPDVLRLNSENPVSLIDVVAQAASEPSPATVSLNQQQIAWSAYSQQDGPISTLVIDNANPGNNAVRMELLVVKDTFNEYSNALRTLAVLPNNSRWELQFDLAASATQAMVNGEPTPLLDLSATQPRNDTYFGMLVFYNGDEIVQQLPVFTLNVDGWQVVEFNPVHYSTEVLDLRKPSQLPINQRLLLDHTLSNEEAGLHLNGVYLQYAQPEPGAPRDTAISKQQALNVQLYWQGQASAAPLMVSVQLLDAEDRKWAQWDGVIGGDWMPIMQWQNDQRVRQDLPLSLDPETPAGNYRVLLVAYDATNGQPVPLAGQQAVSLGEIAIR